LPEEIIYFLCFFVKGKKTHKKQKNLNW